MTSKPLRRWWRVLFGIVGTAFVVITFAQSAGATDRDLLPGVVALSGAFVLAVAGVWVGGYSWTSLFGATGIGRSPLADAFYASQFGKYIPGAVWQAVGQIELSAAEGVARSRVGIAFAVHVVTQFTAGAFVGGWLGLAADSTPTAMRLVALAFLMSPLLLWRRWISYPVNWIGRILRRDVSAHLPAQASIIRSFLWSVGTIFAACTAFTVLLGSVTEVRPLAAFFAFSLAWAVGFIAVPFPSGVGVREAVLLASIDAEASIIIAIAVLHRAITIAAELAVVVISRLRASQAAVGE